MSIELTDVAVSEIKKQRDQMGMPEAFLRIGVSGGCCGKSYALGLDTNLAENDFVFEFAGLKVAVDQGSFPQVDGRVLDFVNGPMGSGFAFDDLGRETKGNGNGNGHGCACGAGGCGSEHGQTATADHEEDAMMASEHRGGGCGSGSCGC